MQATSENQNSLEKGERSWDTYTSWFQDLIRSHSNQDSVVLA